MFLKNLKLKNFRNYKELDFNFPPRKVVLIGNNTCGKTNFLESIFVLATGKSYRAPDADLIFFSEDFFRVEGKVKKKDGKEFDFLVAKKDKEKLKTIRINKKSKSPKELFSFLKIVFFHPEDLEIIGGDPALRRRMIDFILSQEDVKYLYNLSLFKKALKQRNFLLRRIKEGKSGISELSIWDEKIIEPAEYLIKKRKEIIPDLNSIICKNYRKISEGDEVLKLTYRPSFLEDDFREALLSSRELDLKTTVSNIGPHRDNFIFFLDEREMADFCSRGEFRSAILAFRLAEIEFIKEKTKEDPILLLDDVFSELDEKRRRFLTSSIGDQQTIITTTDLLHLDPKYQKEAAMFRVENGSISPLV